MPQPLAVNTMDSAPASICGKKASMAFRMCACLVRGGHVQADGPTAGIRWGISSMPNGPTPVRQPR